ncbi:c-type cytochrome [Opitutus sp. GAS368]|uniref:c-type cytochrome n=1 Tax=Opitutus sp. GAS368 TaxID=1882749 RepID=UPI00087D4C4C|nr:c-type cytochrome [Opitutus sp. GAS368]SDS47573.1 cytochrome c [Opitutus sp. GAS368]
MKRIISILCLAGILDAATGSEPALGDVERGRKVFATCAACHREVSAEVPNPGPDLRGVLGRPSASMPNFRYSRALRNAKWTWSEAALNSFLTDPQAAVPGNTMPFPGLPDDAQRQDLIAYLKTFK